MKLARTTRLGYKHLCLKQQTNEVVQLVQACIRRCMQACMHPQCHICVVIRVTFTTRNFMMPSLFKNFSLWSSSDSNENLEMSTSVPQP